MSVQSNQRVDQLLTNAGDMALKRRARRIIGELSPKSGDKIIDIGCGDGYYLHLLANLGVKNMHLVGIDYDAAGLEKTRHNLRGKHVEIYTGDLMDKLPFATATFNKAVMSEVAEHLPNDVRGLKEVWRILKPEGMLCLTVPHANYPFLWDPINWLLERILGFHVKSGFLAGIWNQHKRLYSPDQIQQVLGKAGFEVQKVESLTWWCLPFNHYLVNLVARYLSYQYRQGIPNAPLNKFTLSPKRGVVFNLAFGVANAVDRLNDLWPVRNSGVSVFVKAVKSL